MIPLNFIALAAKPLVAWIVGPLIGAIMFLAAYGFVTHGAYQRGYKAAEARIAEMIRDQAERLRRDRDRLRTMPDAHINCELERLSTPELSCP
jgi:hypothetical protein